MPAEKRTYAIELMTYSIIELRCKEKSVHNLLVFFYTESNLSKINDLLSLLKEGKVNPELDFTMRMFRKHKVIIG